MTQHQETRDPQLACNDVDERVVWEKNGSPRYWATSDRRDLGDQAGLKLFKVPLGEPLMLYLGIDQHAKQNTVSLRVEDGNVLLNRQVSTEPERCLEFLTLLNEKAGSDGYIAIVEVCGFNDWLLQLVPKHGCKQMVLIQPEKKPKIKTDRRDAHALSELLWINRDRLKNRQPIRGVRQIVVPDKHDGPLAARSDNAARSATRSSHEEVV